MRKNVQLVLRFFMYRAQVGRIEIQETRISCNVYDKPFISYSTEIYSPGRNSRHVSLSAVPGHQSACADEPIFLCGNFAFIYRHGVVDG